MHFPRSDTRCLQKKSGSVLRSERNIARYGIAVIGWMLKPSFVAVSHRRWNALPAFRYSVSSEEVRISAQIGEEHSQIRNRSDRLDAQTELRRGQPQALECTSRVQILGVFRRSQDQCSDRRGT